VSNWAVIVGVDVYDVREYWLSAAVDDAVRFWRWCIDPTHGNVPPENINLLLAPRPEKPLPPDVLSHDPEKPTRDAVSLAISDVTERSNGRGERLFFYFAGHGLTAQTDFTDQPAICLSNFTKKLTNNALDLATIFEQFRATQFEEQYFFIDACRNTPFPGKYRISGYDVPATATGRVFPQFIAFATQPGNTAAELIEPGYEGGAFTRALMEGLNGKGGAKQWDPAEGHYTVRWSSLFRYVEQSVLDLKLSNNESGKRRVIQEPRTSGEKGTEDPILATFAEANFGKETLRIDLNPPDAATDTSLRISETGQDPLDYPAPLASLPCEISLPPRIYSIVARGQRYRSKRRMEIVELYDSEQSRVIELLPAHPPPADVPAVVSRSLDQSGPSRPTTRAGQESPDNIESSEDATVTSCHSGITLNDPLIHLELATESGQVVASGRGSLSLPPESHSGVYRARVVSPDSGVIESLVELSPNPISSNLNLKTLLIPRAETEGLSWAIDEAAFPRSDNGLVQPSEAVGPSAFVKLSTILALSAAAKMESDQLPVGAKLRSLPLTGFRKAFPVARSGIQVVLGDESGEMGWVNSVLTIRRVSSFATISTHSFQTPRKGVTRTPVATAEADLPPGAYWLDIDLPQRRRLRVATTVLHQRVALIVLTREPAGEFSLHEYSVLLESTPRLEPLSQPGVPTQLTLDPEFRSARFPIIRRLELMQRFLARGQWSPSAPDIDDLLEAKWTDPVAGCLGGYLLVRQGRLSEVGRTATNLCEWFGGLSDAWVLRALALEFEGKLADCDRTITRAVEGGVPTMADGVRHLSGLIFRREKGSAHKPLLKLAKRIAPEAVFTSFSSPHI
jgi:uncharacterized caspase-like protein